MKKKTPIIFLLAAASTLIVLLSITTGVFFFWHAISENNSLKNEVKTLRGKTAELDQRIEFLLGENTSLSEERDASLQKLKENFGPLADGSVPWERFLAALEKAKAGDWAGYWEFLNREYREGCPQDVFVSLFGSVDTKNLFQDLIFLDEAMGKIHAAVWFLLVAPSGEIREGRQPFLLEDGQWMLQKYPTFLGC